MFDWQAELATNVPAPVTLTTARSPSLTLTTVTQHNSTPATIPKPSFAQALRGPTLTYTDPLPAPTIRGEMLSIQITKDAYLRGLEACRTNLQGRLMLNKGDKPYSSKDLFIKLQTTWKVSAPWSLRSIGRGFYEFTFAT